MIDAVVVGAGLGGLMTAGKLARRGKRILVLERKLLPGGTAYVFRRGGYQLPMGPLSFGFPERVHDFLVAAGCDESIAFKRCGFELRTPRFAIMLSQPLADLRMELGRIFPAEAAGLAEFFGQLEAAVIVTGERDRLPDETRGLSAQPAAAVLDRLIKSVSLKNLLGSLGTTQPEMSMLGLASMWRIMAGEGIWFPVGGVHGLADGLLRAIVSRRGDVRLGERVRRILVRGGRASGVVTEGGQVIESRWVISNADYKTTFLELIDPGDIPRVDLGFVRDTGYTGSELGVYLGLRPGDVDLSAIHAEHLFYRRTVRRSPGADPEDFDDREIEICLWSRKAPELAPSGRAALVLRVGMPYGHFARWREGDKLRRAGYREYKAGLAAKLIRTAESALPGLSSAIEFLEAATPLTYRDWGGRFEGSIAGWSWAAGEAERLPARFLVQTPVPGLLAAGIYASADLSLGGVGTALYTGSLAADHVLAG